MKRLFRYANKKIKVLNAIYSVFKITKSRFSIQTTLKHLKLFKTLKSTVSFILAKISRMT